ncbi:23S rRNA (adenine(1618)-N(6))-methyltransferase RlmF [Tamlana sp. 2201CG12-4]|uniref:23S rRNA (adenine(1618)-N(6))-methyltransferase RlmF n=1 Tax=Tamlana sp. 2201CG12-4 TaxID=3112582 RepID=UPI002DB61927|nr:23S rRNA (adenine(1618)-N(6))-methyltransferase RlmF [Tamlana sp. 2201CG12-4]MEC3908458.1 23S rRNA (adenine(1618)-N(6))-methyltransferase RlmF [Tamlana sp. 2201CG12-4]
METSGSIITKNKIIKTNTNFHPNNKHKSGYDLEALCKAYPDLQPYVFENNYQIKTIDFANPKAVKALNTALLFRHYKITYWDFPETNLCPPIPGRVDYIHGLADVLKQNNIKSNISVLDIGTGASCIYPILGHAEYEWKFVGTDIDKTSLDHAQKIINKNQLDNVISLRYQTNKMQILKDILTEGDRFSIVMCNPPFYKSEKEAFEATTKKLRGLNKKQDKIIRNFSGTGNELWYKGGEKAFIHNYLYESSIFKKQCKIFTSLVSKKDLIPGIYASLKKLGATEVKTINMGQGNKVSRIVVWRFE